MKKLLVLMFAFFIVFEANETTLGKGTKKEEKVERANFLKTYSLVREYEGNYSNDPKDRGGETYGGIARRFNNKWYGWRYIDQKRRKRHELVEPAEFWVRDYYLDVWVKEGWDRIVDQKVANYLFEFRINSPVGPRIIQKSLRDCGFGINIDNTISEGTINAINLVDPKAILAKVKYRRIKFYKSIVNRDSSQKPFLKHWLKRANNFG